MRADGIFKVSETLVTELFLDPIRRLECSMHQSEYNKSRVVRDVRELLRKWVDWHLFPHCNIQNKLWKNNLEISTKVNSKIIVKRENKLYETEANMEAYSKAKTCTEMSRGQYKDKERSGQSRQGKWTGQTNRWMFKTARDKINSKAKN